MVIAPLGEGPVELSFGATIGRLFALAVAVAVVGLVLLVLAILLMVRVRRRRTASAVPVPEAQRGSTPLARVAVLALMVPLAGCGSLPEPVAYQPPTKVALTEAEVPAMLVDYDKRNNAANRADRAPGYDSSQWQKADAGVLLDADVFNTFAASVFKTKGKHTPFVHEGGSVFASEFEAYPMWAIVPNETRFVDDKLNKQTPKEKREDEKCVDLSLFSRAAAAALQRSVESQSRSMVPPEIRRSMRQSVAEDENKDYIARTFYSTAPLADQSQGLFTVPLKGGVLVISSFALRYHKVTTSTSTAHWVAPYDDLRTGGSGEELVVSNIATASIFVPEKGKPRVLGLASREILTSSANGVAAVR